MKTKSLIAACVVSAAGWSGAQAETFQLDITADGDSRYFDLFSGAFAQVDQVFGGNAANDGFFSVADETNSLLDGTTQLNIGVEAFFDSFNPVNFVTLGGGVDVFPNEEDFTGLGSVEFDSGTGNITDLTLNVFPFVTGNASFGPYTTEVSSIVGTVTQEFGGLSSIDVTANVAFVFAGGAINYSGQVSISGDQFDLFVDEEKLVQVPDGFGGTITLAYRQAWDIEGQVNNLVPEPASLGLVGLGLLAIGSRRRRG